MRPDSYWRGFWADRLTILASVAAKESGNHWPAHPERQRQQYWWRGFQIQRQFDSPFALLQSLVARAVIVATHSLTHREVRVVEESTHRIFACTPALRGP